MEAKKNTPDLFFIFNNTQKPQTKIKKECITYSAFASEIIFKYWEDINT